MRNLADSLKESMGNMITNAKGDRLSATKLGDQMLAAAVLRQERNYEMPKKMHDDESDNYSHVQNSRMFATAQNPYYQPVGGVQHAKNQVNASSTTLTQNQYKRDRSSSNNARRPPIPGTQ